MPSFSKESQDRLSSCHYSLQLICNDIISFYNFTVLCGHRTKEEQNKSFQEGKSKLQFPHSKHNSYPSLAVDIAPYPINWHDRERFFMLAGMMFACANKHNIKLRWGGNWNGNFISSDQKFDDLPHFEVITAVGTKNLTL